MPFCTIAPSRRNTEPGLPWRDSGIPGRWAPAPAALAVSTTPGLRAATAAGSEGRAGGPRVAVPAPAPGRQPHQLPSGWGRRCLVPERASLGSAGECRSGGAGGRDRGSGALLPLTCRWQHFAQRWEAGRAAQLQLPSPPARLLPFAGSGCLMSR